MGLAGGQEAYGQNQGADFHGIHTYMMSWFTGQRYPKNADFRTFLRLLDRESAQIAVFAMKNWRYIF
jgi:hypothetical protein